MQIRMLCRSSWITQALVFVSLIACRAALMTPRDFERFVMKDCSADVGASSVSLASVSLETFIRLLEQIESAYVGLDAPGMAALLLRRFSNNYMRPHRVVEGRWSFVVDEAMQESSSIAEILLRAAPSVPFQESLLSRQQKCLLYLMLSHQIQAYTGGAHGYQEIGVVSIGTGDDVTALDLSSLLKGIVASKYAVRESIENILKVLRPFSNHIPTGHVIVDHIYGPTLAATLGTVSTLWLYKNASSTMLGRNGVWNSVACPREFRLSPLPGHLTDAQISSAFDGFIMSIIVNRIGSQHPLRLSQLLSMYYSSHGIRELIPEIPEGVSFCNRWIVYTKLFSKERLLEQTSAMVRLYTMLANVNPGTNFEIQMVAPVVHNFTSELEQLIINPPSQCLEEERLLTRPRCRNPSNVFILLDPLAEGDKYDIIQRKLTGYIADALTNRNPETTVKISQSAFSDDPQRLKFIYSSSRSFNSTPSCRLAKPYSRGCTECHETDIWRGLKISWMEDTIQEKSLKPSRTLVYFKFGDLKSSPTNLNAVLKELRTTYKDLYTFGLSPNSALSEKLRFTPKDAVVQLPRYADDSEMRKMATELVQEICQAPAVLRCRHCHKHLGDNLQTLSVQHIFLDAYSSFSFIIHPEDLGRIPLMINITISSEHLPLRVCYERLNFTTPPMPNSDRCNEVTRQTPIVFSFANLCTLNVCETVYFNIVALSRKPGTAFVECQAEFDDPEVSESTLEESFQTTERSPVYRKRYMALQPLARLCNSIQSDPSDGAGKTLDYVLNLVTKLEISNANKTALDIASFLIYKYSANGYDPDSTTLQFEPHAEKYDQILMELLFPKSSQKNLKLDDTSLTDLEKCDLFEFLSHTVHNRVESGVANIGDNPKLAVSLSKVLHGIIIAGSSEDSRSLHDLVKSFKPNANHLQHSPLAEQFVNVKLAATFGDILLGTVMSPHSSHDFTEGHWKSELHPYFYYLEPNASRWLTYSNVRGAIDGYILAQNLRHTPALELMPLSDILRSYYSFRGINTTTHPPVSVCDRYSLLSPQLLRAVAEGEFISYFRVFAEVFSAPSEHAAMQIARDALALIRDSTEKHLLRMPEFCRRSEFGAPRSLRQDTPLDLHVLLQTSIDTPQEELHQKKLVQKVLSKANLRDDHRVFNLYLNQQRVGGVLHKLVANSSQISAATAILQHIHFKDYAAQDPITVFNTLAEGIQERSSKLACEVMVQPSQIVLAFNYMKHVTPTLVEATARHIFPPENRVIFAQLISKHFDQPSFRSWPHMWNEVVTQTINALDSGPAHVMNPEDECSSGDMPTSWSSFVHWDGVVKLLIHSTRRTRPLIVTTSGEIRVCWQDYDEAASPSSSTPSRKPLSVVRKIFKSHEDLTPEYRVQITNAPFLNVDTSQHCAQVKKDSSFIKPACTNCSSILIEIYGTTLACKDKAPCLTKDGTDFTIKYEDD